MINLEPLIALVVSYFLFTFIISIYLRIKKIKNNKKAKSLKNINK